MKLHGKIALVTGANSGLGRAISIRLAEKGAVVGLLARTEDKLRKVCDEISASGGSAITLPADLGDEEQTAQAVERLAQKAGGLDILVNNAGLGIFKSVAEMSVDEWDRHINVMLRGAFIVTHYALPHLFKRSHGHVINISSLWAKRFCATCAAYTAAKFGMRGFTESLREECRAKNIKVTNIMPGTVNTPFFEKANWETDLGSALMPDDVAHSVISVLEFSDRAVVEELVIQSIQPAQSNHRC